MKIYFEIVKMKSIIIFILCAIACNSSCSVDGEIKELGKGYFIRYDGCDILNHDGKHKDVPPDILEYNYDRDFIIAAQRPKQVDDAIYNNFPEYPLGRDTTYYWLIVKDLDLELGPLSKSEFNNARILYKVDDDLQLKPVNE